MHESKVRPVILLVSWLLYLTHTCSITAVKTEISHNEYVKGINSSWSMTFKYANISENSVWLTPETCSPPKKLRDWGLLSSAFSLEILSSVSPSLAQVLPHNQDQVNRQVQHRRSKQILSARSGLTDAMIWVFCDCQWRNMWFNLIILVMELSTEITTVFVRSIPLMSSHLRFFHRFRHCHRY
jgi:hypothetical protein